jgi:phage-related protein
MGSSVVELGNNFATTERDILTFAQRIAGAGQIAGLTESDVFAIGAAFSSVGVQAEAGGTAVQKVLLAMNQAAIEGGDQLEIFAATAGLSADDFATAFEEDAAGAFTGFVEGLGLAGDDAINILSALGLEDQRLIRSFLSLAGAGDLLSDAIDSSADAFEENTALTKEAEQRYRTTASQFKIFKNVIKDVGITIGSALLPFVNDLLQAAKPLISELGRKLPAFLQGKLIPTIKKVIGAVGDIIKIFSKVISGEGLEMTGIFERFGEKGKPFVMFILNAARFARNDLIPAIQTIIQWIGQALPVAIQFLADLWSSVLWPAISAFGEFVTSTLIPLLSQLFTWLSQNIPVALQTLSEFWTGTLQPAIETVMGFIRDNLQPILVGLAAIVGTVLVVAFVAWASAAVAAAAATIAALAPILIPLALIGAAAALIFKAWTENWGGIRDIVLPIVQAIVDFITTEVGKVVAWVQENWPLIQEVISDVLGTIQTIVSTILTAIRNLWIEHGDTIKTFINTLWNLIKSIIEQAMNLVRGAIQAVLFIISGNWEEAWNLIKATAQNIWNALVGFFKQAGPALWDVIRNIVKQIPNIILSIGAKLLEVGGKIVEKLREGISNAWDSSFAFFRAERPDLSAQGTGASRRGHC